MVFKILFKVCVCVYMCHSMCAEVREQLGELASSLLPFALVLGIKLRLSGLLGKHLCPVSSFSSLIGRDLISI